MFADLFFVGVYEFIRDDVVRLLSHRDSPSNAGVRDQTHISDMTECLLPTFFPLHPVLDIINVPAFRVIDVIT